MAQPDGPVRRLHIGGKEAREGWEILDARPGPHVDHLGDAGDLSRFGQGTFAALYASHVLEHFDYQNQILATLHEWFRVLRPGGALYVSVPDLEKVCRLYLAPGLLPTERFEVMRIMFGGHMHEHDYHQAGIDEGYLAWCLNAAGFAGIRRVESFGLFNDTSDFRQFGVAISLNLIAERPTRP